MQSIGGAGPAPAAGAAAEVAAGNDAAAGRRLFARPRGERLRDRAMYLPVLRPEAYRSAVERCTANRGVIRVTLARPPC